MEKIYIVGPKASYVSNGRSYKPGDEIDGKLFSDTALAAAIKGGHLIEKANKSAAPGPKALDDMTLAELKAYAETKKIPVSGNKAETLAAIKEAEEKVAEPTGDGNKNIDDLNDDELIALASKNGIDLNLPLADMRTALKAAEAKTGE
jgi:hypothetical protein